MAAPVPNQQPVPFNTVMNRPFGYLDSQGRVVPKSFQGLAMQGDENGGTTLVYVGFARPGASTSGSVWQIMKLTTSASGNVTAIQWPQNTAGIASNDFIFQWTGRAALTYS